MIKFVAFYQYQANKAYYGEFMFKGEKEKYHLSKWKGENRCTVTWSDWEDSCGPEPMPHPQTLAKLIPQHVYIKALLMCNETAISIRNEKLRGE